jgi:twinkle protein
MQAYADADIVRSLWKRQGHRALCPNCSDLRSSKNRGVKTLSIDEKDGKLVWFCHHCDYKGSAPVDVDYIPLRPAPTLSVVSAPIRPEAAGIGLSDLAVDYLGSRAISEATAMKVGCFSKTWRFQSGEGEGLWFPYLDKDGRAYAHKIRSTAKDFSQAGACVTLFNQQAVQPDQDLYIVEGEIDALSLIEIGVNNVVSIPNGAPSRISDNKIDPSEDRKFAYIWSAKDLLESAKRIIIASDADIPGEALAEELARRIGKARCWTVRWPEGCKDANDVLVKHGADALRKCLDSPDPWPIVGVYEAKHYEAGVRGLYSGGLSRGVSTGWPSLDDYYTVVPGHLAVVTGQPGDGKSSWVDALMVNLAQLHNWSFAIYSTERSPDIHIALLASLYLDKPFFSDTHGPRLSEAELDQAIEWVNDHFVFIGADESPTVDSLIDRLKAAVMRRGVRGFVIDPASYLRGASGSGDGADHQWVGYMLEAFKAFAQSHDCTGWLVAHPRKPSMGQDVPRGYEISGSAHWFNRPDFGITIHRPYDARHVTEVHIWKARFFWTGREGKSELFYKKGTGRFNEQPEAVERRIVYGAGSPWDL